MSYAKEWDSMFFRIESIVIIGLTEKTKRNFSVLVCPSSGVTNWLHHFQMGSQHLKICHIDES